MNQKTENERVELLSKTLGCEDETARLVLERMRTRRLIKLLTAARVEHGLTQKEVASRMNCSESKVSRMESATDAELNFGDVAAYAKAIGLSMSILFDDSTLPNATRIKHCVCKIASMLKHLTELAAEEDEDDRMKNAINAFQVEVLMNFLIKYRESGAVIPSFSLSEEPPVGGMSISATDSARQDAEAVGAR